MITLLWQCWQRGLRMDNAISIWVGVLSFLLILGAVGRSDYEDQVAAEQRYCEMVESKAWPSYNPNINCEE